MDQKLKLSRLRDIGWAKWDPLHLLEPGDTPDGEPFENQYDSYLINAAGQLRRNTPVEDVVRYLVQIESTHMLMGNWPDAQSRAEAVVAAILADKLLWKEPFEED